MKGLIQRVGSGERGFTLIELLVVIAILGIIAAVVVLNIGSFLGSGAEEAANTEAHQVQTAVIALAAANPSATLAGTVGPESSHGARTYLLNPGQLQADYTINSDGLITGATPVSGGKWDDRVTFSNGVWG
jgi:type IV pilus assembly protein PilA